jgi:hypothetical protein
MSTDAPEAGVETVAARRARIAPLLAAGKALREISRETGIPLGAVHRAKQQIEKATMSHTEPTSPEPTSTSLETTSEPVTSEIDPPTEPVDPPPSAVVDANEHHSTPAEEQPDDVEQSPSYIVERVIDGVPHTARRLTIDVYEHLVGKAIGRGLLRLDQVGDPMVVLSSLFAATVDDNTISWLRRHGWRGDRGRVEEIIAVVNQAVAQLRG